MTNYLGIDIGGTQVKYGIVNELGKVLVFNKFDTIFDKEEICTKIASIVDENLSYDLHGIGISIPGFVRPDGFLRTAGAIHSLSGVNIKDELQRKISIPILVENDANCAALAENKFGVGKDISNFILVTVGTGIGGGIIFNNHLVRGHNDRAGEFSFMITNPTANQNTKMPIFSSVDGMPRLYEYYYSQTKQRLEDGKEIFRQAKEGNQGAQIAINQFVYELGMLLYNLTMSIDPEAIIIGGAISNNELFIELLKEKTLQLFYNYSGLLEEENIFPMIEPAMFLNQSGVIGAVGQFF